MSEEAKNELAKQLIEMSDNMTPIIEVATGFKAKLEGEGWSPTAAEACAAEFLAGMIRQAFR